jgi:phenylalanine-4-hydroxylase
MPKCGLCGFYARHAEDEDGGRCVWLDLRRHREEVWDVNNCEEYLSRLPGLDAYEHIEWKRTRLDLSQSLEEALQAQSDRYFTRVVAVISTLLALLSFICGFLYL